MNINTLIESLENKLIALEAKKKVAIEKGQMGLFEVFNNEQNETKITLELIKMATLEIQACKTNVLRERLTLYVLESLPSLALYFRESSINAVISDCIKQAFDRVAEEIFQNRIVKLVE